MDETEGIRGAYVLFLSMAEEMMKRNEDLKQWIRSMKRKVEREKKLPENLLPLAYKILSFPPFSAFLDKAAAGECNEARNLASITRLISRFDCFTEENHGYGKETLEDVYIFFSRYLRLWYENGVGEYEDEEAYAPPGQVSFLNIHQSKGLEYPVVIVASLHEKPRGEDSLIPRVVEKMTGRRSYEPYSDIRDFDFRRKYYTAFSRAETVLALACCVKKGKQPSPAFQKPLASLPEFDRKGIDFTKLHFRPVEKGHFKPRISFTAQAALYEECPLKYKLSRTYRFAPIRGMALLYGTLVHETIEDIHRAVLSGQKERLTPANVYAWLMADYQALSKAENTWLSKDELEKAFQEVLGYISYRRGDWSMIREAEYPLELVKDEYILNGTIDLLQSGGGKVDIIDFKTGRKPDRKSPLFARYESQLQIYAYLVEEKLKVPVGKLLLYFTGETEEPLLAVEGNPAKVEERMKAFDHTARRILAEDFNHRKKKVNGRLPESCRFCEWKEYCERNGE